MKRSTGVRHQRGVGHVRRRRRQQRLKRPVLAPFVDVDRLAAPWRRGFAVARVRAPALDPFDERRDLALRQLAVGRHLHVAVVADHLHQQAGVGVAGHDRRARIAAGHPARRGCPAAARRAAFRPPASGTCSSGRPAPAGRSSRRIRRPPRLAARRAALPVSNSASGIDEQKYRAMGGRRGRWEGSRPFSVAAAGRSIVCGRAKRAIPSFPVA